MKNLLSCLGVALLLSGCSSIQGTLQQISLAPNVVRTDTADGGSGHAVARTPQMMRAAARATLSAGYSHFKFSDESGDAGTRSSAACVWTACSEGERYEGERRISQAGFALTMFHANEPGAAGAFDAKQVLAQYKG